MASVTARIKQVKQPRGGYIKPSQFQEITYDDGIALEEENLHASVIGMAVDYLTRYMIGANLKDAFKISIIGYQARILLLGKDILKKDKKKKIDIESLLNQIDGLNDKSIIAACKVCTYDVWYRNPVGAMMAKDAEQTTPDNATIENIRVLVNRSVTFWNDYGPVIVDGFTFETNGYTKTVDFGDGDYLTADTLWDFKVSKSKPTNKHTLQLLMYWIMGQHSGKEEYKLITKLGIFNPRLNTVYLLNVNDISAEIIKDVEDNVICY